MLRVKLGIRGRVLTIALVPSFALLAAGVGASVYLVDQGTHAKDWTTNVDQSAGMGIVFTGAMQRERWLSLLRVAGDNHVAADLLAARRQVDQLTALGNATPNSLANVDPGLAGRMIAQGAPLYARMPALRRQVDAGTASPADTFAVWSGLIGLAVEGIDVITRTAPDAATSVEESKAHSVFDAGEAMAQAVALSAPAMVHGWMPTGGLPQLVTEIGAFRATVADLEGQLRGTQLAALHAITASPAWQRLNATEDAIMGRSAALPVTPAAVGRRPAWSPDVAQWQRDAAQLDQQMLDLYHSQQEHALTLTRAGADRVARNSEFGGAGVLAVSLAAFAVALWLSGRLIARLKRLRVETLALADEHLPDIMRKLRAGQPVDVSTATAMLDYGSDEIGQVGEAFNRAQLAAVSAAVTEARTRAGVRAVFLNIAHRSQVVVHKQLEILDKAEYDTDDPKQLDMLFRLDHLATRERRNAENLIILGGEQPGRRWRTPVSLVELVRSAVAETEDYARVRSVRLPELSVVGGVVADLVHLLAELVDNATSFSPPLARVEVTGDIVGRGAVVEIVDQGLGMPAAELAKINETLANPPGFSVDTLSSDSRLGLFVVAQLAVRHGISVRLVESNYGGIRAIVLIPSALLAAGDAAGTTDDHPASRRIRLVDEPSTPVPTGARRDVRRLRDPAPLPDNDSDQKGGNGDVFGIR